MDKKIKVLHIADKLTLAGSTIHGVTILLSWWIPRFDKSLFDVKLCCLRSRDQGGQYVEDRGVSTFYLNKGKFNPFTLFSLLRLIKREKIDVLHLHGYGSTTFGRICSNLLKIPCIVHEHMSDKNIPFYQRWADYLLKNQQYLAIAVSESVKDFLHYYRAIPKEKINIIYNGAPLNQHSVSQNNQDDSYTYLKKSYQIPEENRVLAIIGRLHPIKGHTIFLQAAKKIIKECKNVSFLVVGDGDLLPELQREVAYLKLEKHVSFLGHVDDIPELLKIVDIQLITSLSEGIPLVLFEAMAAKCAVVSTDVGGIAEIIKNEETGFLVPANNPHAIAEKAILLLADKNTRISISKAANSAAAKFDIQNSVNTMELYYNKMVVR